MAYKSLISSLIIQENDLFDAWNSYMENPQKNPFPPSKLSYEHFNFTKQIHENFDFFIKSVMESSLRLNGKSLLNFDGLYPKVLSPKNDYFLNFYFSHNLLFGCSYGKELDLKKTAGECSLFQTTLTNNGICYSFNGQKPSNSFQSGKIVQSLEKITHETYPNVMFQGPGLHDGRIFFLCFKK